MSWEGHTDSLTYRFEELPLYDMSGNEIAMVWEGEAEITWSIQDGDAEIEEIDISVRPYGKDDLVPMSEADPFYDMIRIYIEKLWNEGKCGWEDPRPLNERYPYCNALTVRDVL